MKIIDMSHVMNVHTPGWVGYAGNKMYYAQNLQTVRHRRPAHRHRAARRHAFRRRHARHRQPPGRHGASAARLSLQPRRGGRHLQAHEGLGGDHAGDHRERRRRHPRGRHPHPAHRLAQALRRPAAAGPGAILLLSPRPEPRHAALDVQEEDQMVGHGHRLLRPRHEHLDPLHAAGPRRGIHQEARQDAGRVLRHVRIHPQEIRPEGQRRRVPVPQLGVPGGAAARREPRRRHRADARQARHHRRLPVALRGPRRLPVPHRRVPRLPAKMSKRSATPPKPSSDY